MSSLPFPRHAETFTPPTAASASVCTFRPRSRLRLSFVSCGTSSATVDSSGLASFRHASVTAPPARASNRRPDGGGALVLTLASSAVGISASFIFFSAIRSMLDCKRAAESLEKSFDSTREKLPETMASVRLVGREIGELAVDLSDLSQELRKVVKSSMGVVHTTEAQLHQLKTSASEGTAQKVANRTKAAEEPLLASTVRELRELITDIRSGFGAAFGIASLLMWASNFGSKRPKKRSN